TPAMMTGVGMILGTAAYMSPEQAKARTADKRCDVWAFGCVTYEMLTGTRAFAGEDVSDTLAAVLKSDPDWSALPAETAPLMRRLLRRCLTKDRKARVPDIALARFDLDDVLKGSVSVAAESFTIAAPSASRSRVPPWLPIAATAIVTAVIVGGAAWI